MKALETGATPDLFAIVSVVDEYSLGQRLLQQAADLYCDGEFPIFTDRLRHVIVRWQFPAVVCGRDPTGKIETFSQAFERVTGTTLVSKKANKTRSNQQVST